jgi:xylulokinase/L-xylulokinase
LFCKDWIKFCLTGEIVTDPTDLSDASLIDVRKRAFSQSLLGNFGMDTLLQKLPPMEKSTTIIGSVTGKAAQLTGLKQGLPVVNGMIDVAASAIGTGVIDPSMACTIVGTTLFNEIVIDDINGLSAKGSNKPSLICHGLDDRWLLTYGTMTGTPNIDWLLSILYEKSCGLCLSDVHLIEELERVGAGSDGVMYHPYLGEGGERAPFVKPSASAQFFGLKSRHSKHHMIRAACEGVAYSMKDCYEKFPIDPKVIRIAGGGSKSDFWCKIFANCVGKPIQVTLGDEIGAKGAAITAATSVGFFGSLEEGMDAMIKVAKQFEPDPNQASIYKDGYAIYRKIIDAMWEVWDENEKFVDTLMKQKETS